MLRMSSSAEMTSSHAFIAYELFPLRFFASTQQHAEYLYRRAKSSNNKKIELIDSRQSRALLFLMAAFN